MILKANIARACGLLSLCAVVSGCIVPSHYDLATGQTTNHAPVIVTTGTNPTLPLFLGQIPVPPSRNETFHIVVQDEDGDPVVGRIFLVNTTNGNLQVQLNVEFTSIGPTQWQSKMDDTEPVCTLPATDVTWRLVVADQPFVNEANSDALQTGNEPGHTDENHWEFACP